MAGQKRRIAFFGYHPRWSPDGKHILFESTYFPWMWSRIYLADLKGGAPHEILTERLARLNLGERTLAWFPDGKRISFWAKRDGRPAFWTIPLDAGPAIQSEIAPEVSRQLQTLSFRTSDAGSVADFRWAPSGRAIYFVGQSSGVWNVWKVAVDPATLRWMSVERVTTGPEAHTDLAISRDGKRLLFTPRANDTKIWVWSFDGAGGRLLGEGRAVTSAGVNAWMPALSSDGKRLAFVALRAGKWELWEKSLEDGKEILLSNDGRVHEPYWSPDGKQILLSTEEEQGENTISLIKEGGGAEQKVPIPRSCNCAVGSWSPDQRSIIGEGWLRGGIGQRLRFMLFELNLPTTDEPKPTPREITSSRTDALYQERISPDGKWIVFESIKGGAIGGATAEDPAIFVVPQRGGEWIPVAGGNSWNDKPSWSSDGKTIYFLSSRSGLLNLWGIHFDPLTGNVLEPAFQVTHFGNRGPLIADRDMGLLEISLTKNAFAVPMTEASGSIWMLDNVDR